MLEVEVIQMEFHLLQAVVEVVQLLLQLKKQLLQVVMVALVRHHQYQAPA
jgi:hypothetical protein